MSKIAICEGGVTHPADVRLGVSAMQLKPKQTFKIGDTVELETEWLERDLEPHYWVLTIHEIFRSEEVSFLLLFKVAA